MQSYLGGEIFMQRYRKVLWMMCLLGCNLYASWCCFEMHILEKKSAAIKKAGTHEKKNPLKKGFNSVRNLRKSSVYSQKCNQELLARTMEEESQRKRKPFSSLSKLPFFSFQFSRRFRSVKCL